MKIFTYAIIAVVVAAVVTAFFVVGSPQTERLRRFDSQRVSDLTQIQDQIRNYWQSKQVLPQKLSDLNDQFTGYQVPRDPQTTAEYVYLVKGEVTFNLCATFNLQSSISQSGKTVPVAPMPAYPGQYNWDHAAGYQCFERTIDKQLYPPYPKGTPVTR